VRHIKGGRKAGQRAALHQHQDGQQADGGKHDAMGASGSSHEKKEEWCEWLGTAQTVQLTCKK
jgi:hypothetical protein